MRMIWLPFIIFKVVNNNQLIIWCPFEIQNTDMNEAVNIEEVDSKVYITREGDFTRADLYDVDEAEIFEGSENKITLVQTYSKRFHCTYLLVTSQLSI